jgi:DNA invertase Pin-like site-specific DNA recombinase
MSAKHSTDGDGKQLRGVAYWRMSTDNQDKSIPQQQAEMLPKAKLEGALIVREFKDEGISGGGMNKRDAFLEMVAYCEQAAREGEPVDVVVCYDTSRFSRATSIKTARYIDQLMDAGTCRLLTGERWYDFRREEDRAIFNLTQDFTNNRFLRDHSRRVIRGKKANLATSYFNGGVVPYGFDRMLLDEHDQPRQRVRRGEKIKVRMKGWNVVLVPSENLEEIEVVRWLFRRYATTETSFRALAAELNRKGSLGPGGNSGRHPGASKWSSKQIKEILSNPHHVGDYRYGRRLVGTFHRLAGRDFRETEYGEKRCINPDAHVSRDAHEGLIDRATWDAVQAKIAARRREGRRCRADGFVLSGGLAHCGHCGARMHGCTRSHNGKHGRVFYRYLACSGNKSRPGSCLEFHINEDKLLPFLVKKLQEVYLSAERLEGLRAQLKQRLEAKREGDPERSGRQRAKLAELDRDLRQGARNLVRATENLDLIQEELTAMRAQRDRLQRELEAAEAAAAQPAEDVAAKVDAGVARLYTLPESLRKAKPENLRAVLRLLVYRIDLYFEEPEGRPRRGWYRFAKGVVKLRPVLDLSGSVTHAS